MIFGKFLQFWSYLCQFLTNLYVLKLILKAYFRATRNNFNTF
jgi:hypothetical protein